MKKLRKVKRKVALFVGNAVGCGDDVCGCRVEWAVKCEMNCLENLQK